MATETLEQRRLGDRWLVEEPIARGGMSTVYRGLDELTGERVAIKVLRPDLKPELRSAERFRREARLASRLDHENIVALRSHGELDGGRYFLVLEHIDGVSLHRAIHADAPFGVRRSLRIAIQIAKALAHAHENKILHRDLKPGNVLLSHRWEAPDVVKVLDFGLAKSLARDDGDTLTRTGLIFGTPEYISPEQACGQPADGRCDIYAAGAILFEMLVGRPPFIGKGVFETLRQQVIEQAPAPSDVRDDLSVPPVVEQIISKCLEKRPENRFASAAHLSRALEAASRHLAGLSSHSDSGVADSQMPTMGQDRAALLDGDEAARAEYDQLRRHRQETLRRATAHLRWGPVAGRIDELLARIAQIEQLELDQGAELALATSAMEELRAESLTVISQLRLENIDRQMEATTLREALERSDDDPAEVAEQLGAIGQQLEEIERRLHHAERELAERMTEHQAETEQLQRRLANIQATLDGGYDELAAVIRGATAGHDLDEELKQLLEDLDSFDRWIAGHKAIIDGAPG